ncbi:hypothetical protein L9F63_018563 [Diploptera punctata]|uniref:CHK kinase-like domain-containing protein n=1 Tax=Diploptera punctata TaxID=6984 RepID=A0AAD7ZYC1_DIPPU|nr:hypothetical protein L9F63_018563 [Diploptera punctata]
MEEPTHRLKDVLKTVLEELKFDPNSEQKFQQIVAHLLLSCLYRVTVHSQNQKYSDKKFIIKTLRQDPALNDKFETKMFFRNESLFYKKLVESFFILQDLYLDDKYERFLSFPKCYKSLSSDEFSVISLNLSELFLVMKELGRFHALTLFFKYKKPTVFSDLRSMFKEPTYRKEFVDKTFNAWASSVAAWVLELAKENFPPESEYIKKLETFATDRMSYIMLDVVRPKEEDEEFNVFNHGDLWVNNLLFHYPNVESEDDKKPDKMCFIDFQQCRYGSIGLDLSAALFLLTDQETRSKHRDELLGVYHHNLSEFLIQFGYDSARIFPYSAVESQLKKCALYGLGVSFLCLSYNLDNASEEDVQDDGKYVKEITEDCRKRILDVIKESVDFGYL